ncbi:MAG: type II toxin-antitoxin system prevent-host-death family antitoxin, partial [Deltaproteobacteria bacterium]
MQTLRATDANRQLSNVLKQVSQGEEFLVISRGKPVATILPVKK